MHGHRTEYKLTSVCAWVCVRRTFCQLVDALEALRNALYKLM